MVLKSLFRSGDGTKYIYIYIYNMKFPVFFCNTNVLFFFIIETVLASD